MFHRIVRTEPCRYDNPAALRRLRLDRAAGRAAVKAAPRGAQKHPAHGPTVARSSAPAPSRHHHRAANGNPGAAGTPSHRSLLRIISRRTALVITLRGNNRLPGPGDEPIEQVGRRHLPISHKIPEGVIHLGGQIDREYRRKGPELLNQPLLRRSARPALPTRKALPPGPIIQVIYEVHRRKPPARASQPGRVEQPRRPHPLCQSGWHCRTGRLRRITHVRRRGWGCQSDGA